MTQRSRTRTAGRTRRWWERCLRPSALTTAALAGCSSDGGDAGPEAGLGRAAAGVGPPGHRAPDRRPDDAAGTRALREIDKLPFKVEWANISGGPQTLEAFRADALDVGAVADIPPLLATWTGPTSRSWRRSSTRTRSTTRSTSSASRPGST